MTPVPDPMAWQDYANCLGIDPDLFFPEIGDNRGIKTARAICAGCTVKQACRDYAIVHEYHGIWGGTTPPERRQIRRQHRLTLQAAS